MGVKAQRVLIVYPAKRCVLCGDKIKGTKAGDTMIFLPEYHGGSYLEDCCVNYFEHGYPDRPGLPGVGPLEWV
jgi:hypothetical protein